MTAPKHLAPDAPEAAASRTAPTHRPRGGLILHSVLLCILLVTVTSGLVVLAIARVVDQPVAGLVGQVIPLTLLVTIAGATLAYLLARRVLAPISILAAAAARFQQGDFKTPIPNVSEPALVPLAQELESARQSLHRQVAAVGEEEARHRALFSALDEPIVTTTPDGRITDFNQAAKNLLGGVSQLYGQHIGTQLPFLNEPANHEGDRWLANFQDASGRTVDVEVGRTILGEDGERASHVYVIHDISHHADLNRMREQLLYSVAHEIRGPLSVLENTWDLLAGESASMPAEEFAELMASARRTSRRLRILMEDLLSAGSIQAGRFLIHASQQRLQPVIEEALDLVEPSLLARSQTFQCSVEPPDINAMIDPAYLRQVLTNLLSNACKYSPDGSTIELTAEESDGMVRIAVQDRGPGIAASQRSGLFERFYRLRPGDSEPGIGLGLAIARGIVLAHGGTIGVESEEEKGTRVWFTVPRAPGGSSLPE